MTMQFIDCVNRILRINGILRGDTDTLSTFTDQNHASSSAIAQVAVQNEIVELSSRGTLPYQFNTTGSITLATGTRTYALASNFEQMYGDPPYIYDSTQNFLIPEYPGGEQQLRVDVLTYTTDQGTPTWFYFEPGTTQQVSFYQIPNSAVNGRVLTYNYMASVNVSASTDTIPFSTTDQQYAFTEMAARRFKFLFEGKVDVPMDSDPVYREARSRLFSLLKWKKNPTKYGKIYISGYEVSNW